MYIHIGNDVMLKASEIIGIFDISSLQQSRMNLRILNQLKKESPEVKSVIVTEKNGEVKEFFSIISALTLKSRLGRI